MPDVVELSIPAKPELLSLARLAVAAVAARADFDLEEIEDLRLALDELCSPLLASGATGTLHLCYEWSLGALRVECTLSGTKPVPADDTEHELSNRILDALVDDHGSEHDDAMATAWLAKRRRGPDGA
jgi:serine/threonine-protein kinase RsbW